MSDTIRPSRTATYELTVAGLLTKRADLFNEAERLRDRMGVIRNDVSALDRVLISFGYTGDLDAEMPRAKRQVLFGGGELSRAILDALRDAPAPMPTRDVARHVLAVNEADSRDRRLLTEVTRRASKALRIMAQRGLVRRKVSATGNALWEMAN